MPADRSGAGRRLRTPRCAHPSPPRFPAVRDLERVRPLRARPVASPHRARPRAAPHRSAGPAHPRIALQAAVPPRTYRTRGAASPRSVRPRSCPAARYSPARRRRSFQRLPHAAGPGRSAGQPLAAVTNVSP